MTQETIEIFKNLLTGITLNPFDKNAKSDLEKLQKALKELEALEEKAE